MLAVKFLDEVRELYTQGQTVEEMVDKFGTHLRQVITHTVDQLNAAKAGSDSGHAPS